MKESGFTLIELLMIILILGILAAVAAPKYFELRGESITAATEGVAGALSSAFAVNYTTFVVNSTKAARLNGTALVLSSAANAVMLGGTMPSGYSATAAGSTVNCGNGGQSRGRAITISVIGSVGGGAATAPATLICTG